MLSHKLIDGWYAKDGNGDVCYHHNKPCLYDYWWDSEGRQFDSLVTVTIDDEWTNSLYQVFDGTINHVEIFKSYRG